MDEWLHIKTRQPEVPEQQEISRLQYFKLGHSSSHKVAQKPWTEHMGYHTLLSPTNVAAFHQHFYLTGKILS